MTKLRQDPNFKQLLDKLSLRAMPPMNLSCSDSHAPFIETIRTRTYWLVIQPE